MSNSRVCATGPVSVQIWIYHVQGRGGPAATANSGEGNLGHEACQTQRAPALPRVCSGACTDTHHSDISCLHCGRASYGKITDNSPAGAKKPHETLPGSSTANSLCTQGGGGFRRAGGDSGSPPRTGTEAAAALADLIPPAWGANYLQEDRQ